MNFIDNISDTQFEELCYELLIDLGFSNLSWRKGTATNASPADQGRDIEATYLKSEIDNSTSSEKWFVECKHYREGVPPTALQGALAWAESCAPHTLLIIASGFLSNQCKENLKDYQRNRHPPFRIKVWEKPDLERMLLGRARLLNKYNLAPPMPHMEILHPAHKLFLRKPSINTMDYFLEILTKLDHGKRDSWLFASYLSIINPEMHDPVSSDQSMGELTKTPISYHEFKIALHRASHYVSELFLIQGIINCTLASLLMQGDITALQELKDNHKSAISFFEKKLKTEPKNKQALEGCIKLSKEKIKTLELDLKSGYEKYCEFCEVVLNQLLLEKYRP